MAATHKGAISFGLVHIPIELHTATQDNDVHFNQLCKDDMSRVRYKKICASCGKEVKSGRDKLNEAPFLNYPADKSRNDEAIWIHPELVCTVKYMEKTAGRGMRQPVYKGLRKDKLANECKVLNV